MFAGRSHTHDQLLLFYADELTGPWTEHIHSPVVLSDPSIARPGGHVFEYEGQLYRLGQDCVPRYGSQLRAFRITSLTTNSYIEEPVSAGTVLTAGPASWNRVGMHHCDLHPTSDGRWTAAVDGHTKQWNWRFGLPN